MRFLIHLSTSCKYRTVINYLSAINVLHRHFGLSVTFQEVFTIKRITRGLRRILGDAREQKLPITPDILRRICHLLSADVDSAFWAAILIGFYTFFRKSNLVPKSAQDYDSSKNLCRSDFFSRPWGLAFCVRWSKNHTIQAVSFVDTSGSPASGPPFMPSTSLWTPSALPPGSILLTSLPQVL